MNPNDFDDEVRQALHAEADRVHPDEGLSAIRSRTHGRSRTRRWVPVLVGGLAAAAVVGAVVVASVDRGPSTQPPVASGGTQTTMPADEAALQLWYVTNGRFVTPETVSVASTGDLAVDAVNGLLTSQSADPDDANPWACFGTLFDLDTVTVSGSTAAVTLSMIDGPMAHCQGPDDVTLQQLAWTLRSAVPGTTAVTLDFTPGGPKGFPDDSFGASLDPYAKAQIIVDTPAQDSTVSSPVRVSGESTANEGTVNWILYDGAGDVVQAASYMGGSMGTFEPYSFNLQLDPGDYSIKLLEYSAKDGSELNVVTKDFTVQ